MAASLVCPSCAVQHGDGERFCRECGMPLVHPGAGEARVSERQERARKIKPQYAQGALARVPWARNQAEGELTGGVLREEASPSLLRRPAGFDVPDFMAAGPRDVLVPQSGLEAAREVLLQTDAVPGAESRASTPRATRVLAALLLAVAIFA